MLVTSEATYYINSKALEYKCKNMKAFVRVGKS